MGPEPLFVSLEAFLEEKRSQGGLDSKGRFTLDFGRASKLLSALSQTDDYHCFLKLVQIAHRLGAERCRFRVGVGQVSCSFECEPQEELEDLADLLRGVTSHEVTLSPLLQDVRTALLGGTRLGPLVHWERESGRSSHILEIASSGRVRVRTEPSQNSHSGTALWTYTVKLSSRWRVWQLGSRIERLKKLLGEKCLFSAATLTVNGDEIPRADLFIVNSHLREFHSTQFNAAIGAMQNLKSKVAASCIVLRRSSQGFGLTSPDQTLYTKRQDVYLWAQGLRNDNSYRPDTSEAPAWMFLLEPNDAPSPQGPIVCDAVVALNIHGPGNQDRLRVKVVRRGVLLMEAQIVVDSFQAFRGCSVILDDDELATDLSGLKLVESEELLTRLSALKELVDKGHERFELGERQLHWA